MALPLPSIASTNIWSDRVAGHLVQAGNRIVVMCDNASGIEWAIHRLEHLSLPLLRIWIPEPLDSSEFGVALADSVRRCFGHEFVNASASIAEQQVVLGQLLMRFRPIRIVIGWLEHCPQYFLDSIRLVSDDSQVILLCKKVDDSFIKLGYKAVSSGFLRMRPEEATVARGDNVEPSTLHNLYSATRGRFGAFLDALGSSGRMNRRAIIDDESTTSISAFIGPAEPIVDALWHRGRIVEAFELACSDAPALVPELIEVAGNYFFDRGAFHYFWDCLNVLPNQVKTLPGVTYWIYASAAATNRLSEVQLLAQSVLGASDAPDLRAAVAVMRPGTQVDHETVRAINSKETAVTVRARAFALALGGDRHSPVLLLRRAMALAEQTDANHLVVACALDISNQEITLGRLRSGRDWAIWALHQYEGRHLGEEYRRQSALAGVAFAKLLLGEVSEAKKIVDGIGLDLDRLGVPTYESVVSTVGDSYLISEDPALAAYYYECILNKAPLSQYASASLDVTKAEIAQRHFDEAAMQAERAYSVSRTSSPLEQAFGSLNLGMAQSVLGIKTALPLLEEARTAFGKTSFAIFELQTSLWIARTKFEGGDIDGARRALERIAPAMSNFALSGWRFQLANYDHTNTLIALQEDNMPQVRFRFLGGATILVGGEEIRPSMRHCEILTMMADRPNGLTSEKLQLLVFGDSGTAATTKATVSRLRKVVPVSAAPYQIQSHFAADFSELLRHLDQGDLFRALRLYRGQLLPGSDAPGVVELRNHISESIRRAVLSSGEADLAIDLATVLEDDLEVWEHARSCLRPDDRRKPLVSARIRRVKANW